jgi:hypothetical protein
MHATFKFGAQRVRSMVAPRSSNMSEYKYAMLRLYHGRNSSAPKQVEPF